jgi:RNA-directed DNA polymerase
MKKTINYQEIDWKTCHEKLAVLQARLVEAHRAKDARGIKDLQRSIVTSFAARALAVRRVTTNKPLVWTE